MTTDPIRPEDQSLGAQGFSAPATSDSEELAFIKVIALKEAIRQTFERDAAHHAPSDGRAATFESDPDTEIDRQARLIVDAEYRRRKEAQSND